MNLPRDQVTITICYEREFIFERFLEFWDCLLVEPWRSLRSQTEAISVTLSLKCSKHNMKSILLNKIMISIVYTVLYVSFLLFVLLYYSSSIGAVRLTSWLCCSINVINTRGKPNASKCSCWIKSVCRDPCFCC